MAVNTPSQVTTWKIDPMHSSAEFAVKHMMFTTVRGRLAIDGGEHPTITFKSTKVEHKGGDRLHVHGDLTIHGVTKSVILDTTTNGQGTNPYGQTVAGFTAETQINRKDFGLTYNAALETGGVLVSDNVKITLEIQAAKQ